MTTCANLIRQDLKNLKPYNSARKEAGYVDVMLNANECAWPNPFYPELYRYPNQQPQKALTLLSRFYTVNANELLISRGSDEAIELLIRLFCEPGKEAIMICPPTFAMYQFSAKLQAIRTVDVPLTKEIFDLDVNGILSAWEPTIKILFLCSPNNPIGNIINSKTIEQLCQILKNKCIVVVDEAYIEYSRKKSVSRFINRYDNLVILRTLSKAFGLAGARCGIALSNKNIIQSLLTVMAPYPIPSMLIDIIEKNLDRTAITELQRNIKQTRILRDKLIEQIKDFSFIKDVRQTETNFILIKVNNSTKFLNYCEKNNILLRDMSRKHGLKNNIRISIGSENDTNRLINCMRQYDDQN